MGWTSFEVGFNFNRIDWFKDEYTFENERVRLEVLKTAVYGNEIYAAVKEFDKVQNTTTILAYVCLTKFKKAGYGSKDFYYNTFPETSHPYYYNAPASILKLLTEPKNEDGRIWREQCQKRQDTKKLQKNIRLPEVGDWVVISDGRKYQITVKGARGFTVTGGYYTSTNKLKRWLHNGQATIEKQ